MLIAFMPWNGYNFEDSILISERVVEEDRFTTIHIEELTCVARETKLGPEEITADIPNVNEAALRKLDEAGIVYIGAEVKAGDLLSGKVTPKGETQLTPEEKLLRAIFGEKASDVKDTSLRVPAGMDGTVIDVRVFTREGVKKDKRALAIEESSWLHVRKDLNDQQRIFEDDIYDRLRKILLEQDRRRRSEQAEEGREGHRRLPRRHRRARSGSRSACRTTTARTSWKPPPSSSRTCARSSTSATRTRSARSPPGDELVSGRAEDGQGLPGREAPHPAGRQDGRPPRQQGRRSRRSCRSKTCRTWTDGTPVDIVLNPLGVPSRMNIGQLLEVHLGWAAKGIGKKIDEMLKQQKAVAELRKFLDKVYNKTGTGVQTVNLEQFTDEEIIRLAKQPDRWRADRRRRCSTARPEESELEGACSDDWRGLAAVTARPR